MRHPGFAFLGPAASFVADGEPAEQKRQADHAHPGRRASIASRTCDRRASKAMDGSACFRRRKERAFKYDAGGTDGAPAGHCGQALMPSGKCGREWRIPRPDLLLATHSRDAARVRRKRPCLKSPSLFRCRLPEKREGAGGPCRKRSGRGRMLCSTKGFRKPFPQAIRSASYTSNDTAVRADGLSVLRSGDTYVYAGRDGSTLPCDPIPR